MIGTLRRYNPARGWGFLEHHDTDEQTFCHVYHLNRAGIEFPRDGDVYEFQIAPCRDDKHEAVNMKRVEA